jgi:hypothetical protein
MHHGVADLDTGGPAVEQNSARFEFLHRQQLAGVVVVGFVGVHGRGQLAFDIWKPSRRDPVKPTALIRGSVTRAIPSSGPDPKSREKVPAGNPASATASVIARPTSSEVPGWASCALTTTGHPAARADAVARRLRRRPAGSCWRRRRRRGPARWSAGECRGVAGLSVGKRGIDTGAVPAAFTENVGEQAQLARGTADLAGDAGLRESGFRDGASDDVVDR